MKIKIFYRKMNAEWMSAGVLDPDSGCIFSNDEISIRIQCVRLGATVVEYELDFLSKHPTRIKLQGELEGNDPWHLIPCCIHGDNNLENAIPDQYPNLTTKHPEKPYSSPYWEFRADRASHPISICISDAGVAALSIDPYMRDQNGQLIRNGVFSELPNRFGATAGYANLPFTFENKRVSETDSGIKPSKMDVLKSGHVSGRIYWMPGAGRADVRKAINDQYLRYRERPRFKKTFREASQAILDMFQKQNWSEEFQHYTNQECHPPQEKELKPWRALLEIGWTGGSILAYPFLVAERVLNLPNDYFATRKSGRDLFDEIVAGYNPDGGMFYDLVRELRGSRVNGWWDFLKITHDCHSAYTNGHALYYLFRAMQELRERGESIPDQWRARALEMADNMVALQREDGCIGYSFRTDRREVNDFKGFAGCWIAAALAVAYEFHRDPKHLAAAERAAAYFHPQVRELNACGAPMDTWKAPDEEGNLAFMKLTASLHKTTGKAEYLRMLEDGAHYEYLWRYAIKAIPEILPLKDSGWNSCGGSVTSVSNPHIHPMGLLVTPELYYLYEQTGDPIHKMRAEDGAAWAMNCLELYPEITGYGHYGVTTERYCPSDGLWASNGEGAPTSMWLSYNGWGAANELEALLYMTEHCPELD